MLKLSIGMALCAFPAAAAAQSVSGPYVSGELGASVYDGGLKGVHGATKINLDTGVSGAVALGWRFRDGLRAELQAGYQSNGVSDIFTRRVNGNLDPLSGVSGHLATYSAMANLIYDIPVQRFRTPLQPYIGLGAGYGRLDFNGAGGAGVGVFHLPENNTYTGADTVRFGSGGAFAYRAIIGAALSVRSAPGLELTAEYRYLGMVRTNIPVSRIATGGNLVNGITPSSVTHNDFVVSDDIIAVGLRYSFGSR